MFFSGNFECGERVRELGTNVKVYCNRMRVNYETFYASRVRESFILFLRNDSFGPGRAVAIHSKNYNQKRAKNERFDGWKIVPRVV